jgi:hypothetical protein
LDIGHWTFLHDAYRQARLAALVHEQEIKHVLSLLRAVDIEPVLVKGWAIARLYPDRALRPYGDIDLCVRPDQFEKAAAALKSLESIAGHYVDLHSGFGEVGRSRRQGQAAVLPRLGRRTVRKGYAFPLAVSSTEATPQEFGGAASGTEESGGKAEPYRTVWRQSRAVKLNLRTKDDWDELFARSRLVPLGDEQVRVLCDEDHLRILCLHLLRSGAWRPLWLCDVALLLEKVQSPMSKVQSQIRTGSRPGSPAGQPRWGGGSDRVGLVQSPMSKVQGPGFDWDVCLGSDPLYADWVAVTIGLAHQLLGVEVKDTPVAERAKHLPRWLVPAVLKQWGREHYAAAVKSSVSKSETEDGRPTTENTEFDLPRSSVGGHRSFLDFGHWTDLYQRWDNPVRATAAVHGQFNNWPRLPYRLRESVMRSRELPKALASMFRESVSRKRPSQPLSLLPDS